MDVFGFDSALGRAIVVVAQGEGDAGGLVAEDGECAGLAKALRESRREAADQAANVEAAKRRAATAEAVTAEAEMEVPAAGLAGAGTARGAEEAVEVRMGATGAARNGETMVAAKARRRRRWRKEGCGGEGDGCQAV